MRPIDGAKLEEILEKWLKECEFSEPDGNVEAQAVYACICELHNMPTLDVAPVVHGKWIACDNGGYYCSNCDHRVAFKFDNRYCPHCSTAMDEE